MESMLLISNRVIDMTYVMEQWKRKHVLAYNDLPHDKNRWIIDSKETRLYIDYDNEIIYEYEEVELDNIDIKEKHFYNIAFRNYQFLKRFLFETDFKIDKMYVDDNQCTILPFEEFKMLTKNDEEEHYIPIIKRKTFS